jgi:hypothetical protein
VSADGSASGFWRFGHAGAVAPAALLEDGDEGALALSERQVAALADLDALAAPGARFGELIRARLPTIRQLADVEVAFALALDRPTLAAQLRMIISRAYWRASEYAFALDRGFAGRKERAADAQRIERALASLSAMRNRDRCAAGVRDLTAYWGSLRAETGVRRGRRPRDELLFFVLTLTEAFVALVGEFPVFDETLRKKRRIAQHELVKAAFAICGLPLKERPRFYRRLRSIGGNPPAEIELAFAHLIEQFDPSLAEKERPARRGCVAMFPSTEIAGKLGLPSTTTAPAPHSAPLLRSSYEIRDQSRKLRTKNSSGQPELRASQTRRAEVTTGAIRSRATK